MLNDLTISYRPTAAFKANPRNARSHSKRQLDQIIASIRAFGFTNPILVDETDTLIAGHGRLEAARRLGLETIASITLIHLNETEKRALMLADNKIASNAGWDTQRLAIELADLSSLTLDFDITATGFEIAEIDAVIMDVDEDDHIDASAAETAPLPDLSAPAVSRRGDIWQLGAHRLMCGDALSPDDLTALMAGAKAGMGITDPPYNVPIAGHVSGGGKVVHREFAQASGEMTSDEFTRFLSDAFTLAADHSHSGAVWYAFMDWRHIDEISSAGKTAFGDLLNLCVWTKTNGGMGALYRSQHELVFVFRTGKARHRNNVQLGRFGRNRTNVWRYPGVNSFRTGRMEELQAHPTAKPVALIKDAILDVSKPRDIVLDPFMGAGATLMAAHETRRTAYGLELDPLYVDTILRRWRRSCGDEPVREADGMRLVDIEAQLAGDRA